MARSNLSKVLNRSSRSSGSFSLAITGGDIETRFATLVPMYEESKAKALRNLGQAAVNKASKVLDETGTRNDWGGSRMRGEKNGVRFAPYGNSSGRNDTGKMIRSLSHDVSLDSLGKAKARFGWIFDFEPYFKMQDQGFRGFTHFAGVVNDKPVFRNGRSYWVEGANSLPQARDLVDKIKESFFSGAWNDTVREWNKMGRKSNPGSYLAVRKRYQSYKNQGRA